MSHRSSDAYSRRPTDDRPRDTLPSGSSDLNKEDRRRRSLDARDRLNTSESPRDSTRPLVNSGSARSLHRKASTTTRPADGSSDLDRGIACDTLVGLCKKYAEAVIEVARLKAERDPLDKVLKQRQAEYERSMAKHAELFPSVPEVQGLHRIKYAERVKSLDTQIQNAQRDVDSTAEAIAQTISDLARPSANSRDGDAKTAALITPLQQQEASKKHQADVAELKSKIRKIEAEHSQQRSELKAEFGKHMDEMREQMAQMQKVMKELKKDEKGKDKATGDVKEQIRAIREDIRKRQSDQEKSHRNEVAAQLSKHGQELMKTVDEKLSSHTQRHTAVSSVKLMEVFQNEKAALKSDISGLVGRVEALAGELAVNARDTVALRNSLADYARRVQDEARKIEEHEAKLSSLDTDSLEEVAEMMSIGLPELRRKLASIQTRVDAIPQETDDKQQALYDRVVTYVTGMGGTLGEMLDTVQKDVAGSEKRIKALEEASAAGRPGPNTAPNQTASDESEAIRSEMASIKSDVASSNMMIARLNKEHAELTLKLTHSTQTASMFNDDVSKQLAALRQLLMVLETRFNNLSTRSLAEYIIGHLEQLYPDARQLVTDVDALKALFDRISSRVESLENRLQDFKVRVDSFSEGKAMSKSDVSNKVEELLNGAAVEDNVDQAQVGQKRKRVDSTLNGSADVTVNGGT